MSDHNNEESSLTGRDDLTTEAFQAQCAADDKRVYRYTDRRYKGEVRGILKSLFESLQVDLSITKDRWNRLMDIYLRSLGNTGKSKVEERSSMNKILMSNPNMTLVTFYKALGFLRVVRARISVRLVFYDNTTTEHGIWFNVNNPEKMTEEDIPGELAQRVSVIQRVAQDPIANQEILPTSDDVKRPTTPAFDPTAFSRAAHFGQPDAETDATDAKSP